MVRENLSIWKRVVVLCVLSSLVMSVACGFQSGFWSIQNSGLILTIGVSVFEDEALSKPCLSIVWPTLTPGDNASCLLWVRNDGNFPIVLHMNTSGWVPPEASLYLSLGWDRENEILDAYGVVSATLILQISPEIQGITNYSFTITLSGESAQNI